MENVTDRTRNPFGMDAGGPAVYGYGDANADVHVVGDHPGVHGGATTGVPFTGTAAGRRLQGVLHEVGLLPEPYSDQPAAENLFFSYLVMRVLDREPTGAEYADARRLFDAELRAITAHVLVPVGSRPIEHVLQTYTTDGGEVDPAAVHGREIGGGAWLVLPLKDPTTWTDGDRDVAVEALETLLATDYRRQGDLGRFTAGGEPYFVR